MCECDQNLSLKTVSKK